MGIRIQETLGAALAGSGVIWSAKSLTENFTSIPLMAVPPAGPLELCGAGVIVWLLAKWRRAVRPQ